MNSIKPGDYLITKNKELFRITNKYVHGATTVYDIKGYQALFYDLQDSYGDYRYPIYQEIKGITHSDLRHLGRIVPEESATKAMEVLYKS